MDFNINDTYHGFLLKDSYRIDEVDSTARIFEHIKTGARLLHLENTDDNKVFSIAFRTPPSDDTGVPHIVEHCVLSGSRKYHTKEPFMDMVKGSLQTFINAMTYGDKTIYPIASKNEKDFYNLMDVYLDAVFYPKIGEVPEIFMQEGWCFDIDSEDDSLKYNGVVYNEMKGAYSDPITILEQAILASLYPDNCYKYSSGGDPDSIPDLTFEDFNNFHKNFYHPSNSYIYLYGDGNINEQLAFINDNYLTNFEKASIDSSIPIQKPFVEKKYVQEIYNISKDEPTENKTYLSKNYIIDTFNTKEIYLTLRVLKNLLIDSPAAPLKKALLEAGIGEDVMTLDGEGVQPFLSLVSKNTSESMREKFEQIIDTTLKKLVVEGVPKDLILSCINMVEYDFREANGFPTKGIIYNIKCLDSWLYDGNETSFIEYNDTLKFLRAEIDNKYFENFIEKYLLDNTHCSVVTMCPEKGLSDKKDAQLKQKLEEIKQSFSSEELQRRISASKKLKERQLAPDTPEALATMPKLEVSDVNEKAEEIPQEVLKVDDTTVLFHNIFANNLSYVDIIFDINSVSTDDIPYINILSELLGKVSTNDLSYSELSNEIFIKTGGIEASPEVYTLNSDPDLLSAKFILNGKCTSDNISNMMSLVNRICTASSFSDKSRIKDVLQQMKSQQEMDIFSRGIGVVSERVCSYFSMYSAYSEKLKGLDFFWFLSNLLENFDENYEVLSTKLEELRKEIFNTNNLLVSFTGDLKDFEIFKSCIPEAIKNMDSCEKAPFTHVFPLESLNEGIKSSSNVQYAGKGYNLKKLNHKYSGSLKILQTILNGEYLHDRVRAKGGAYGCRSSFTKNGNFSIVSYRDPNLKETLDVYDSIAGYLETLNLDTESLTKYIIGTMSSLDSAETPHAKGETATACYISGISQNDIQNERTEILSAKPEDIKALASLVKDCMDANSICVLGNAQKIEDNKELFKELKTLQ